jgi:hypothetical protein
MMRAIRGMSACNLRLTCGGISPKKIVTNNTPQICTRHFGYCNKRTTDELTSCLPGITETDIEHRRYSEYTDAYCANIRLTFPAGPRLPLIDLNLKTVTLQSRTFCTASSQSTCDRKRNLIKIVHFTAA